LNIKQIKIPLLILTVLFLILTIKGVRSFNPSIDAWYAVEDWELEVCSKWGGTQEVASGATSSSSVFLSRTTLSLQGEKQTYDITGVNQSLYAISWYLEPLTSMSYRIELIDDATATPFRLDDGEASYENPAIGYHSEYYDINYTSVKMTYGLEWIEVPLIEIE